MWQPADPVHVHRRLRRWGRRCVRCVRIVLVLVMLPCICAVDTWRWAIEYFTPLRGARSLVAAAAVAFLSGAIACSSFGTAAASAAAAASAPVNRTITHHPIINMNVQLYPSLWSAVFVLLQNITMCTGAMAVMIMKTSEMLLISMFFTPMWVAVYGFALILTM